MLQGSLGIPSLDWSVRVERRMSCFLGMKKNMFKERAVKLWTKIYYFSPKVITRRK